MSKAAEAETDLIPWRFAGCPVTIGACTMPVGSYYVGDLTYVLDPPACDELQELRKDGWGQFSLATVELSSSIPFPATVFAGASTQISLDGSTVTIAEP